VAEKLRPGARGELFFVSLRRDPRCDVEQHLEKKVWAIGQPFDIADCAAVPVLFYAESVHPFSSRFERLADYFGRISQRRCFRSTIEGARPYFNLFPYRDAIPARFL